MNEWPDAKIRIIRFTKKHKVVIKIILYPGELFISSFHIGREPLIDNPKST